MSGASGGATRNAKYPEVAPSTVSDDSKAPKPSDSDDLKAYERKLPAESAVVRALVCAPRTAPRRAAICGA